jgi:hypothetical protein
MIELSPLGDSRGREYHASMLAKFQNRSLELALGDIAAQAFDATVYPANGWLACELENLDRRDKSRQPRAFGR